MYENIPRDGLKNISGTHIRELREKSKVSQGELAAMLQERGLDLDENAVQRIECGKRRVTDIELMVIAEILDVPYIELFGIKE